MVGKGRPRRVRGVGENELAAVYLENTVDDGKPEAGALLAGGDIGLGQSVAVAGGQAHAIVFDLEGQAFAAFVAKRRPQFRGQ